VRKIPHYPFDALIPYIEDVWSPDLHDIPPPYIGPCGKAAIVLGVHSKTPQNWVRRGLGELQADRMACRLGYHPSLIWPEWWDGAA
jgi:hypothetical protein